MGRKLNIVFSSKAHRVNMDVKTINFVHRKMYVGYFLEGMDSSETIVKNTDSIDISYTNLAGGNDTYHYKVYDADSNQCLADLSVSFRKNYKFWEQARVKVQRYLEFLQEKEAEISELAYKDLVTGVFNRNYFEQERARIDVKKLTCVCKYQSRRIFQEQIRNFLYGKYFADGCISYEKMRSRED